MQTNFENFPILKLHQKLDAGQFALPKLQRAFVWNGAKAAKMLDSVYEGMPIGSVTVWDTSKKNRDLLRISTKVLPPYKDHHPRVLFVLDGQQRLSVLHRVRAGGIVQSGRRGELDFGRMVFRVTGEAGPRFQYRNPVEGQWISLPDILAPSWKTRLGGLTKGQLKRVENCRDRLLAYELPCVRVETDDIDVARELFIRINSTGTPLGAADRAFARASEFDLRERADQAAEKMPDSFRKIRNEVVLQTLALLEGFEDLGGDAMEKVATTLDDRIREQGPSAIKQFTKTWDRQQKAMHRALDLLRTRFHVLDDGLLPSQYMVATLTVFFFWHARQPQPEQLAQISRWFWSTALGSRYSGSGYRGNILRDSDYFKKLAGNSREKFKVTDLIDPTEIRRAGYGKRSAIADAFFCLLIAQKPKLLANATLMQMEYFASNANRRHKHHIFPRHLLAKARVGVSRLNSILNLCFIPAEENSKFGARPPHRYLLEYYEKRYFQDVMDRHLISHNDEAGIWKENASAAYSQFLKEREALVCAAFEKAAGCRLFRRG